MSFEFQSTLVNVTPTFRIGGNQIGGARKEVITGIPTLRLVIVDDADIRFALSGPFESGDPDAIYTALSADLYEIADGLLINEGAVSSVEIGADMITVDFNGEDHTYKFKPNADATGATEVASHTWEITTAGFAALSTAAATWRSSLDGTLEGLSTAITTEIADRIAAITAEEQRVDALIASGMWLFADQAAFPPAADNHGRVVHSHADASMYYSHGGMWHKIEREDEAQAARDLIQADVDQNEADSDAADAALSGRLDVLEADPTTATAVAAVQSDVDQNEADSDAADAALSGRLDVLEADPVTKAYVDSADTTLQNNIDSEAGTRASADSALDGRLDVLETDPTTATAVAAVQSDVDQNEADGDAADAALSGRLDVLEADPTTQTALTDGLALKAPLADPDFTGQLEVDVNLRLEYDSNLTKIHNILRGTSIEIGNNIQMRPATAGGRVEIAGGLQIDITEVPEYSNDTQAAAGGIIVGGIYRSGSVLHIRVS